MAFPPAEEGGRAETGKGRERHGGSSGLARAARQRGAGSGHIPWLQGCARAGSLGSLPASVRSRSVEKLPLPLQVSL